MATTKELVLDARRRTTMTKIGRKEDSRYLVEELEDGTLILLPATLISEAELAALRNPEIVAALDQAKTLPRSAYRVRGKRGPKGQPARG